MRTFVCIALSLFFAGWTGARASAQEAEPQPDGQAADLNEADERARTHFESGRLHYEEGAYDLALSEFTRAWELSHRPALLMNLATVNERLGNYEEAAANLRGYIDATPDLPERARLERRIENLRRLLRQREEADASDGEDEGGAPSSPVSPVGDGSGSTATDAAGPDEALLFGGLGVLGVGVVGVVMMGTFGGLALSADGDLRDGCGATATCTDADVADANTFALVSDVSLGLAVAGLGVGAVLVLLGLTSGGAQDEVSVTPVGGPGHAGLVARGSF